MYRTTFTILKQLCTGCIGLNVLNQTSLHVSPDISQPFGMVGVVPRWGGDDPSDELRVSLFLFCLCQSVCLSLYLTLCTSLSLNPPLSLFLFHRAKRDYINAFYLKLWPEYDRDCLVCATFARHRTPKPSFRKAGERDLVLVMKDVEMCSGSKEGSYLRHIDLCITQLWASEKQERGIWYWS